MRVLFMGGPEFSIPPLQRLIAGGHELVAVCTQPDRPAGRGRMLAPPPLKAVAVEHGLKVIQPSSFREPGAIDLLAQLGADVIVVAAYGKILPRGVLSLPPFGCLNIHPSLLPRHRGATPVQGAILGGDEYTGVTIILMEEGVDSGPILSQRRVNIEPQDTTESLTAKLAQVGAQLLEETLPLWLWGTITLQPQEEAAATYTRLFSKGEGEIDWHLSAVEIWRRVRAFHPWPGCYTTWRGKILKILEAMPFPGGRELQPGRVKALRPEAGTCLGVETGEGTLGLIRVQLEGRRAMSAAEFLRGHRGIVGAVLPSLK